MTLTDLLRFALKPETRKSFKVLPCNALKDFLVHRERTLRARSIVL